MPFVSIWHVSDGVSVPQFVRSLSVDRAVEAAEPYLYSTFEMFVLPAFAAMHTVSSWELTRSGPDESSAASARAVLNSPSINPTAIAANRP